VRDRLVGQRTGVINQIRAFLLERGIAVRQGLRSLRSELPGIPQHVLRVSCSRCGRTVEIQKADAVRLHGSTAVWKDVGQRLLDNTCQQRTGRHEEDGCWPVFE
jgi:hypothetical protein